MNCITEAPPAAEGENTSKRRRPTAAEEAAEMAEMAAKWEAGRVKALILDTADMFFPALLKASPELAHGEAARLWVPARMWWETGVA